MTNIINQTDELLEALEKASKIIVPSVGEDISKVGVDILSWVRYLRSVHLKREAIELLNGTESALIEACAYCCLGLGRAAIAAIRTQMDLLLCYTYFRDHPVEWKKLKRTGEGYRSFSEILKYHVEIDSNFSKRLEMVNQVIKPSAKELYNKMSAHIHAQSTFTIPTFDKMDDLVLSQAQIESVIDLQRKTSIALSALLLAIYGNNWADLPPEFYQPMRSDMSEKQASTFFK